MPKPTLFCVSIDGQDRLLFSVQERSSGDLTLVMKHSLYHVTSEGSTPAVQERFSVHTSPASASINAIKYTKVMNDGRQEITRNYSEAMKKRGRFCGLIMRRAGNLSDARYTFQPSKGRVISLGPYDPTHFQPTIFVLVGLRDRIFNRQLAGDINVTQVALNNFSITVMWQFFVASGMGTTQNLIPRTFKPEEIDSADPVFQRSMAEMAHGLDEREAYDVFRILKTQLSRTYFDDAWKRTSARDKKKYEALFFVLKRHDIYISDGVAFGPAHTELMQSLSPFINLYKQRASSGRITK